MKLRRRSVLRLSGVALASGASGCGLFSSAPDDRAFIASRRISSNSSRCADDGFRHQLASTSYDSSNHRLTIDGRVNSPSPCPTLSLTAESGEGTTVAPDSPVHLTVDPSESGGCPTCPAVVRYAAAVEFAADPPKIYVHHLARVDGGWKRTEPITEQDTA